MFRLIRLPFLLGAAFVAGVLYERNALTERCVEAGGSVRGVLCFGVSE